MSDFTMDLGSVFGGTDFTTSLPEIDFSDVFENTPKLGQMDHVETNGNLFRPIDTEPTFNLFQRTNTTIPLTPEVLDQTIDNVQFPEAETQPWQRPILPELFDHLAGDLGTMLQPADDLAYGGFGRQGIVPDMNLLVAQYTPKDWGAPDGKDPTTRIRSSSPTGHSTPIEQPPPFILPNNGGPRDTSPNGLQPATETLKPPPGFTPRPIPDVQPVYVPNR